ncbi:MAG: hypothetical protein NPIRA02_10240 [Nitrospirales bacterium]|nr:MAG: hypothetical protein NPIRA02_10240 [Nitrospirales bacterium]
MNASTLSLVTTDKQYRTRRAARQLALQCLFQEEFQEATHDSLDEFWREHDTTPEVKVFAGQVVAGVTAHKTELDTVINAYAVEWSLSRMPVVDRNILRCALFEFFWLPDVPAKVTINEALELAKRFADEESKRFLNGMLDRIIQQEPLLEAKRVEITARTSSQSPQPQSSQSMNPGSCEE